MFSTDTIAFPQGYTAYLFGSATAGWKQEVNVEVQSTGSDDEAEYTFEATKTPLVVTGGGLGFANQETVVIPADDVKARKIELDFRVFKNGSSSPSSIQGFNKNEHSPVDWVTNYTYTTEDGGGDNDFHDTTLLVSLVKDSK